MSVVLQTVVEKVDRESQTDEGLNDNVISSSSSGDDDSALFCNTQGSQQEQEEQKEKQEQAIVDRSIAVLQKRTRQEAK